MDLIHQARWIRSIKYGPNPRRGWDYVGLTTSLVMGEASVRSPPLYISKGGIRWGG